MCIMQHFFCLWEIVCRFQLNNSPFIPLTDESLCHNVTNKFSSNAQYWVGDKLMCLHSHKQYPADTDVIKTSSGRLKKVTTSYDQTRRLQDVWQMTSDLRRLEDV